MTSHNMPGMERPNTGEATHSATFGVHNQLMVGEQAIYLSHLPMFMFNPQHHPHNFQVILEVTLAGPDNPQATYGNDRKNNPQERMYTMSPDAFAMSEFDPQNPQRHSLTGTIFRGHLERGGEPIIERAVAQVVNTVYFHAFDPNAAPLTQLEYLLFGKAPELFLAHVITKPPDFDQILAVTVVGQAPAAFTAAALNRGIRVSLPDRANTAHTRLKSGEQVTSQVQFAGTQGVQPLSLATGIEFYFEEGELRLPMTMAPTPEERAAGF